MVYGIWYIYSILYGIGENRGYGLWCCTLNSTTASERYERARDGIFPRTHISMCG